MARRAPEGYYDALWKRLHHFQTPGLNAGVKYRLVQGEAADEILRLAQELDCDLIVMGTHGRKGLPRLLLGSVAEKVLREATCPVLTIKVAPTPKKIKAGLMKSPQPGDQHENHFEHH